MADEPNYEAPVGQPTPEASPTGVSAGAPTGSGQPTPSGTPSPAGAPAGSPTAAPGVPKGFVPVEHFVELRKGNQALSRQIAQLQRDMAAGRQPPPAAPNAQDEEVKTAFYKLFPNAQALLNLPPEKLQHVLERIGQHEASFEHYWTSFGSQALRSLGALVQKTYGGQPDGATRRLIDSSFIDWLESDNAAQQRFFTGDPTLVEEFWQKFTSSLLDPVRRAAVTTEQARIQRRDVLPRATPRGATLGAGAGQPKPKTPEELHEAAAEAFIASR